MCFRPASSPGSIARATPRTVAMRLLLTGGAGFIGSHVATLLATTYPRYHVVVVDKLDYCSSKKNPNE